MKYMRWIILTVLIVALLLSLWLGTIFDYRIIWADYCKGMHQYDEAVKTYSKILRKNRIKRKLSGEKLAEINYKLGYSYAELSLKNLAIESYANGSAESAEVDIGRYQQDEPASAKLAAIGLLEAGRWDRAIEEFRRLKELYPSSDAEKYINIAESLKKQGVMAQSEDFYFELGDAYIKNQLFDEARAFFTKRILDYGVDAIKVLKYLNKAYSKDAEIKQAVWGENIYISLEDFEIINPQFSIWTCDTIARVNNHYISHDVAYGGNCSELLDVTYDKEGYDYWIIRVNIPLDEIVMAVGVRAFIKSKEPLKDYLKINFVYPEGKMSGICNANVRKEVGEGWEMQRKDRLFEEAKGIAGELGCSPAGVYIDRIVIDTTGASGQFYIDNVDLCILDEVL